jgi:hypothetical protein
MTADPLSRASAQVEANVLRLARANARLDMRVVFPTSEEEGPNGALLPLLEELLPTRHG